MRFSLLFALCLPASALAAPLPALPAADAGLIQTCATHWKDAKAARTTRPGETWPQYLARCQAVKGVMPEEHPPLKMRTLPTPPAEARKLEAAPKHTAQKESPAQARLHARMRQCGALWRKDKAAGHTPAGQTWPRYWSACNKRLKAAAGM